MPPKAAPMLHGLQVLRGLAAMLVVLDHVEGTLGLPQYLGRDFAGGILMGGAIGVDLFFVISGYIIFHITDGLRPDPAGLTRFAVHRFARIVPFMWLCVACYLLLRWGLTGPVDAAAYLRAFVLYPVGEVLPGEVWTLRHEVFFYAFAALALAGPRFAWCLVGFILMALPVGLVMANGPRSGIEEWVHVIFRPRANLAFGVGILVAWCHRLPGTGKLPAHAAWWVTVAALPALLLAGSLLPTVSLPEWQRSALLLPLIGAIVWSAVFIEAPAGRIARYLVRLGDASYSIYLTHALLVALVAKLLVRADPPAPGAWGLLAAVLLSVWVGHLVHRRIEAPLVQWTRQGLSRALARTRSSP